MAVDLTHAVEEFTKWYAGKPALGARAPGRVNIIGEHTDYNHGFVLPMAIEREALILARPRVDETLNGYAVNLRDTATASVQDRIRQPDHPWMDYLLGVVDEVARLGYNVPGLDVMVWGDVPLGSGLSSSAALEMATLRLLEDLLGLSLPDAEAAALGQRVENRYLGVNSGIMDQFISRAGRANHALFLDCRTLVGQLIPVAFENALFVIADTGVSRGLAASAYNARVDECRQAVSFLTAHTGRKATHLRDFTSAELRAAEPGMPEVIARRARHVLTEDERTEEAAEALRAGDPETLGALMNASDASLRVDYEVTCPELDTMTDLARAIPGCYGSRMTGAGFGGCTVHLVEARRAHEFETNLVREYGASTGRRASCIISRPAEGARGIHQ
jgi:galactokinase